MFLGNDLVHWSGPAAQEKATPSRRTHRFIDRVLHEREHPVLERLGVIRNGLSAASLSPVRGLWALWAAKEAAFKAAVKSAPGLPFSPRSIRIEFLPITGSFMNTEHWDGQRWPLIPTVITQPLARGLAHVRNQVYEVLWEHHHGFVHALALGPFSSGHAPREDHQFSTIWKTVLRHASRIPSERASEAVRRIALQLLAADQPVERMGIIRELLRTGRLGPPIFHDGSPRQELDLTLTHDGSWGAAGILCRPAPAHCPH